MPKIPNIAKFKGTNEQSFDQWIAMFEAQCGALEVVEDNNKKRWRNLLMVTTEGDAFATVTNEIARDNNITYGVFKDTLKTKYGGQDYKRHLQTKLRSLKFRVGTEISEFTHELRTTIKELYGITDTDAIDQIGITNILATLDDSLRNEVSILQLAGNIHIEIC